VRHVVGWQVPVLILGGGGYHNADSARCYAAITAEVVGVPLPRDVPEHDYLSHYGPQFVLQSPASNMLDENRGEEIDEIKATVLANLAKITPKGKGTPTPEQDGPAAAAAAAGG
jgi:histone deacetylase 8